MRLLCTVVLFLIAINKAFPQPVWEFHPVITMSNPLYGCVSMPFATTYSFIYRHPLIPSVKTTIPKTVIISTPKGKAQIKKIDWCFKNFAVGYTVGCMPDPEENPVGFQFTLNYERQNLEAKLPGKSEYIDFTRHSVAPEFCMRVTLGNLYIGFVLESGGRLNCAFKASGEYSDRKYVNNGFTGLYGMGFYLLGCFFSVRYEHDYFDFFNQDFVAPNRSKPYKDFSTKHNLWSINITCIGNEF